jgi:hypothetical protein
VYRTRFPVSPLNQQFRYGSDVENYLDVYLRTPGLSKENVARALLARGNARKTASEKLSLLAQQGAGCLLSFVICGSKYEKHAHSYGFRFPSRPKVRPL